MGFKQFKVFKGMGPVLETIHLGPGGVNSVFICAEFHKLERMAGNTKGTWGRFKLLSWGDVSEAYVRNPKWWLQWPESTVVSKVVYVILFFFVLH